MTDATELLALTSRIAAAYLESNKMSAEAIPDLIRAIHAALAGAESPTVLADDTTTPASRVQIRKSITPDALISFEDGKPYKMLRRHLSLRGLTPAQYREKWGLPADYPLVAPNYSATRSQYAKAAGLGRKPATKTTRAPRNPKA
jgi:predicted transcriptional regulator